MNVVHVFALVFCTMYLRKPILICFGFAAWQQLGYGSAQEIFETSLRGPIGYVTRGRGKPYSTNSSSTTPEAGDHTKEEESLYVSGQPHHVLQETEVNIPEVTSRKWKGCRL